MRSIRSNPTLFELPEPDRNKVAIRKAAVRSIKETHFIFTHCSPQMPRRERWIAIKFPDARTLENGWEEIMSHIRRYEESDLIGYGPTEAEAIRSCATNAGLRIEL